MPDRTDTSLPTNDEETGAEAPGAATPAAPRKRGTTRRKILKWGLIGTGSVVAVAGGAVGWVYFRSDVDTVGKVDFTNRLAVPKILAGEKDAAGRRVYDLRASAFSKQFRSGRATQVAGYEGATPGPVLRSDRGDEVLVHVTNRLDVTTSVHWHGMHLPAKMDGGPHQPIAPGATWSPTWTIDQPAATLWYHPHPHGESAEQVYRGLAGLWIVDDPEAGDTGLPQRWGVDDIPVVVQDRKFDGDNQLDYSFPTLYGDVGVLGGDLLVNGTYGPFFDVTTQRLRLRLLNGSNSRVYNFGFDDDHEFQLVATDGGLTPKPYTMNRIQLSPGERAEIVVALDPGERRVLRSYPPELGLDPLNMRVTGGDDRFDVLQLRAAGSLAPSPEVAATLAPAPALTASTGGGAPDRRFELGGHQINGKSMDMNRIDFAVDQGVTEVWEVESPFPKPHNFHVHGASFQVLSVNGQVPRNDLAGWKDTIFLPPTQVFRIAVRFAEKPDLASPFMFHCHLLYHEDEGMMGQFLVKAKGQTAPTTLNTMPGMTH